MTAESEAPQHLRADFSKREKVETDRLDWLASPQPGVERRMLDRIGGEVARATSLVRYAPGSRFESHSHDLGEEFLVLQGTFSDATGDFGPLSYVRNPPGSSHAPWSEAGAIIFVKLRQFDPADTARVTIDGRTAAFAPGPEEGVEALPLHGFGRERVSLERWQPGTVGRARCYPWGAEFFILEGGLEDEHDRYGAGTWLRLPPRFEHRPAAGTGGALVWRKTGHLA